MKVLIETTDNGWIVREHEPKEPEYAQNVVVERALTYQEDQEQRDLERLVYTVIDILGELGSKHAPRLRTHIEYPDGTTSLSREEEHG